MFIFVNAHCHFQEAWVRDFWRRFLSDPDLAKLAYRALLPGDAPKTASTENVAEMSEALVSIVCWLL